MQEETGGQKPVERETARLADLPVEGLPADAPDRPSAATDPPPPDAEPAETAHQPAAERSPRAVMEAYAGALSAGDAGLAADLHAEHALLTSKDERLSGRDAIAGWHEDLLARGTVRARPSGQGNDAGRLEVDGPGDAYVVELSFDASGRIGTARWLTRAEAERPQEERERTAT
jgi:ketosteroid isomerase-like protein